MGSAFRDLIRDDVEVRYVGADSVGDKVVASVRVGALTDAFVEVLETEDLGMQAWGLDLAVLRSDLAAVVSADDIIEAEAWLAGGLLRQVRLDLVGFIRQLGEPGEVPAELAPIYLELEFADFREGVSAPEDAVEVDLFKVMGRSLGASAMASATPKETSTGTTGSRTPRKSDRFDDEAVPGTAPPDREEDSEAINSELHEPDWDQMTDEEFDEWIEEFERQLEEAPR